MLQEAASGKNMPTLQQELEQLHTITGQMKADLQAFEGSQIDTVVPDPCPATLAMPAMRLTLFPNFSWPLCCRLHAAILFPRLPLCHDFTWQLLSCLAKSLVVDSGRRGQVGFGGEPGMAHPEGGRLQPPSPQ